MREVFTYIWQWEVSSACVWSIRFILYCFSGSLYILLVVILADMRYEMCRTRIRNIQHLANCLRDPTISIYANTWCFTTDRCIFPVDSDSRMLMQCRIIPLLAYLKSRLPIRFERSVFARSKDNPILKEIVDCRDLVKTDALLSGVDLKYVWIICQQFE